MLTGDARTIARVQGRQQCGPGWVSHILQTLVLALWSDPRRAGARRARRRRVLRAASAAAGAALERSGVRAHGASGLNVWVPVPDEAGAVGALLQRGWVVAPGAPYRLAGAPAGIRVTTATLAADEAERLAADLAEVLEPAARSRSG